MSVEVREKPISDGRLSLYLQIYVRGQKPKKEFLGIYVLAKPKTAVQREENTKQRAIADLKASERKLQLSQNGGIIHSKSSLTIAEYCRDIGKDKKAKKTQANWKETADHLDKAGIGSIQLSSLTVQDCQAFRAYFTNGKLAQSSQAKYFGLFRTAIRDAHLANFIKIGLHDRVSSIARGNATKEFLRQHELDTLFSTPVRSQVTRKAFLFSCLTGMRHSDIRALKWSNVHDLPDGNCELRYEMVKTGKDHILPIGTQVRQVLGDRKKPGDKALPDTPCIQTVNYTIHRWRARAGIPKKITFHSGRHTFATLALSNGVPLKVVSDYLGHSSITQTEVYARLLEDERDRYVGRVNLTVPIKSPEKG
ncbi:MAG TPA: tyrosine-type recombinase/integrase [Negativicutes bacterium]|nr:tyrosine-type recombinase/integrase [Negativicutes bacterium]